MRLSPSLAKVSWFDCNTPSDTEINFMNRMMTGRNVSKLQVMNCLGRIPKRKIMPYPHPSGAGEKRD
jgi:hypothetical protein